MGTWCVVLVHSVSYTSLKVILCPSQTRRTSRLGRSVMKCVSWSFSGPIASYLGITVIDLSLYYSVSLHLYPSYLLTFMGSVSVHLGRH
ncbi:hypothetical protein FKM82_025481 [Ascaphus truei]